MNEAEIRSVEEAIERLKAMQSELMRQRRELADHIEVLQNTIQALVQLLPPEKRRLFH